MVTNKRFAIKFLVVFLFLIGIVAFISFSSLQNIISAEETNDTEIDAINYGGGVTSVEQEEDKNELMRKVSKLKNKEIVKKIQNGKN